MPQPPRHLRLCNLENPLGIGHTRLEFAWKLSAADGSEAEDVLQSAYAITVSLTPEFKTTTWDSGKVETNDQFGVPYTGQKLEGATRYYWRVKIWNNASVLSKWSNTAWFETAAIDSVLLNARWITSLDAADDAREPLYLHSSIDLAQPVARGRAYISALGWYKLIVNGIDIVGNALVPRWTPFDQVVEYQAYDVSDRFLSGLNKITIVVGDGRFRGHLGFQDKRAIYGKQLAALAQFHFELSDGSTHMLSTNSDWYSSSGSILRSDPKYGEVVDLRHTIDGSGWNQVSILDTGSLELIAEAVERVQEVQRLPPRKIWFSPSGAQLVDFGQNLAGYIRIQLRGVYGQKITLTHSEILGKDGELNTKYVSEHSRAPQRDEVILAGAPITFQPSFTIHGFRFVEVRDLGYALQDSEVEAIVLSTDLRNSGSFHCSNSRLNLLHKNVEWSVRGNFMDVPTDCPTRERSGWTGDIQVFASTATLFADVQAFLRRYLYNLKLEQYPNGCIPMIIPSETSHPDFTKDYLSTSVGWGDAAVMIPWTLYQYYGDKTVLAEQYDSMVRWVEHMKHDASARGPLKKEEVLVLAKMFGERFPPEAAIFQDSASAYIEPNCADSIGEEEKHILDSGFHWGEWLRPGEKFQGMGTIFDLMTRCRSAVATAYFANSARLLSQIAHILGKQEDHLYFADLSSKVAAAWRAKFVKRNGSLIADDYQDDYVRALSFELLLPSQKKHALGRLVELIERADFHLGTGFLSTPMLLPILSDNGRSDVAYRLLLQTTSPSWLHQVNLGATTIWETWEGYDANGDATASHNHYAFGAIASFLHEKVAGLSPTAPGYRKISITPVIGGGLTHASSAIETPFGRAQSSWRVTTGGRTVELDIIVPPGTTAIVNYGDQVADGVGSGAHKFSWTIAGSDASLAGGFERL